MKTFLILAVVVAAVILGPIATIWSLNTLFPILSIPYTIDTWCAAIVLGAVFKTTVKTKA
jgi:hypothetical protein